MSASAPIPPQPGALLNMGVNKAQVGNNFVVVVSFAIGVLVTQCTIPPAAARAFAREILKYADECDTGIVAPGGVMQA